jgi:hypothetical protein
LQILCLNLFHKNEPYAAGREQQREIQEKGARRRKKIAHFNTFLYITIIPLFRKSHLLKVTNK